MNQEVARLLDLAAAVPPARRAALLDRECSDPQVRAEVESLLRYLSGSEAYFDDAVQGVASSLRQVSEPAPAMPSALTASCP